MSYGVVKSAEQTTAHDALVITTSIGADGAPEKSAAQSASPYGLVSRPPEGAPVVVLTVQDDGVIALAIGDTRFSVRTLGAGDVALYNASGACVILKGNDVHIKTPGNVHVSGNGEDLPATRGVVHGQAIDYYTGQTFAALGSTTTKLRVSDGGS